MPGEVLELERDVLGDVAHPRAVTKPRDEPAAAAQAAGMVLEAGQQSDEGVGEARDLVRREVLEDPEVDDHPDDRLAGPVVRAAKDAGLDDLEGRLGSPAAGPVRGASLEPRVGGDRLVGAGLRLRARGFGAACATEPSCSPVAASVPAAPYGPPEIMRVADRCDWLHHRVGAGSGLGRDWSRLVEDWSRLVAAAYVDAASPPPLDRVERRRRQSVATAEVEPIAGRQRVQHDAADHQWLVAVDLPRVRLRRRAVDDGDAPAADDFHDVVGPDDARRVLVDAEAQERRVLGDQRQQAPEAVPLLEVLVDDDPRQHPEAGRDLGHPVLRRRPRCPERDHVAAHRRCAGGCPGHDRPVLESIEDRVRQARPTDRRGQSELVAAGQEDPGGIAHRPRRGLVVGLRPRHGVERPDRRDAELREDLAVAFAGQRTERTRRRDHGNGRVAAAGERDESVEDDPIPDLVLGPADDDDRPVAHSVEDSRQRRGRMPKR